MLLLLWLLLVLPPHVSSSARGNEEVVITDHSESAHILKGQTYTLHCKALNAASIRFRCNDRWVGDSRVSLTGGVEEGAEDGGERWLRGEVNISRVGDDGEEVCVCYASSSDQHSTVTSDDIHIVQAYMRKHFVQFSSSAQRVREGSTVALACEPPSALPPPTIEWTKDGVNISPDGYVIVASDGSLLLSAARLTDQGVYVCHAENMAGRRSSPPVTVTVYVDGGWSEWGDWGGGCLVDCDVLVAHAATRGQAALPRITRRRTCNNPAPMNGGLNCHGAEEEFELCPVTCRVNGGWTEWMAWSECTSTCARRRMRNCTNPAPLNHGLYCAGAGLETMPCSTGVCGESSSSSLSQWAVAVSLSAVLLLLLSLIVMCLLLFCKGRHSSKQSSCILPSNYYGDVPSYGKSDCVKSFVSEGHAPFSHSPLHTFNTLTSNRSAYARCESGYHTRAGNESRQALLPDGSSTSSSARKAFLRTTSSLSQEENYATVYECVREEMESGDTVIAARVDKEGATLMMEKSGVTCVVPEGAFSSATLVLLSARGISHTDIPELQHDEMAVSGVVCVWSASSPTVPRTPLILSLAHCASCVEEWELRVHADMGSGWTEHFTLTNEDCVDECEPSSSSSIHAYADNSSPLRVHCILPSFARVIVTGRPRCASAVRRMHVGVYVPVERGRAFTIRVVGVPEGSGISGVEDDEGYRLIAEHSNLPIALSPAPLCVQMEQLPPAFHLLSPPYTEVSCMSPSFSCSFTMDTSSQSSLFSARLVLLQKGSSSAAVVMSLSMDDDYEQLMLHEESGVSVERRLPTAVKQRIAAVLDVESERDWRSLARILGVESFIGYGTRLASPTTVLLNLWECKCEEVSSLAHALRLTGRPDVAQFVEKLM